MKLDISRQTLQKIIIGVVVLIIVIFVIMRIWRSSRYAWPNASEAGSFTITGVTAAAASGSNPALLTFTTGSPHGYSVGDLVTITGVTNVTYTEPVSGTAIPLNASAGGASAPISAVYIYSVSGSNFTVKGTQAAGTPSASGFTSAKTGTASFTVNQAVTITQGSATGTATVSTIGSVAGLAGSITGLSVITPGTGTFTTGSATVTPSSGGSNPSQSVTITVSSPAIGFTGATVASVSMPANNKVTNTDLLTCQTNYATDLITSPYTTSTASSQTLSSSSRTLNVTSVTGFSPNDKVIIPGVVDSTNKSVVLVVDSVGGSSLTFTSASAALIASGTVLPSTAVSNITIAYNKRDQCVQTSTTDYTVGHCKYLPQSATGVPVIPLPTTDPVAYAAYQEYQTNIQKIQVAYAPAMARVQQTNSFPTGGTLGGGLTLTQAQKQTIVEAARKADLANATQKYLATACPGFYGLTTNGVTTDPSADYKNWAVDAGSTAPTSATNSSKRFWSPTTGISDVDIMKWAQNAGVVTLSGPVTAVTISGSGLGSGYTSAPTVTFSTPSTAGGTTATGTAVITSGKITGVTLTNGGSGYTTSPTITFSGGNGTAPAAADITSATTVQISPVLTASAGLVTTGSFTPSAAGSPAVTYTATKYSTGTAGSENWRTAYKNGPGTYPAQTYS